MIFGPSNIKYFNELEINGQPTRDEDDEEYTTTPQDDDTEDEITDDISTEETTEDDSGDLEDFTEDEFIDDTEDDEVIDDENESPEDDTDEPEVVEEEPASDEGVEDTETPEDDGGDLEDFTEDEFIDDTEDDENSEDEDETNDYTQTTDDSDNDGKTTDDAGDEDTVNDDKSSKIGNKLSDMEKNLFADLTPQQLAIKNNELLQNYIALYDTIGEIFDNINKIPKTYTNTRPLTFIADQLVELKDMVNYIITTTYITRTYVENMTYYKQSLVILTQLNTMIKELSKK